MCSSMPVWGRGEDHPGSDGVSDQLAILHYTAWPVVGGVESTIYHHARCLAGMGYPTRVVAGQGEAFHPQVELRLLSRLDSRHPEVLAVGRELAEGRCTPAFERLRERLRDDLQIALDGCRVCIVHNALTLHKNLALTAALHDLVRSGALRVIAWSHDFAWQDELYLPDLHPGYPWDLLRQAWQGVRYVVVSEHRRDRLAELLGLPPESIAVVNPGVEPPEFLKLSPLAQELVEQFELDKAGPLLLLPARLTRRKNIAFALQTLAALTEYYPQACLVVTGPPGPHNPKNAAYLQELKTLRAGLGLDGRALFLYEAGKEGEALFLPDEVVADFYHLADLLFFPSLSEGFGIPILEAGLARLPVFAADIPPVRESAGELAQLFNPRSDPGAVAARIHAFLQRDQAYLLRQRVLRRHTWRNIVADQLAPLLNELSQPGISKERKV